MVRIAPPPPPRPPQPLWYIVPAGASFQRIYDPTRYGQTAAGFRTYGPRSRFDHHRHPSGAPADDPARGITYGAFTLSGCIVEVFGDRGEVECGDAEIASLAVTRDLRLLDLRGSGAMRAGSATLGQAPDRALTQAWSRYFYEQPALYGTIDGLSWHNAHNEEDALVLYERATGGVVCPAGNSLRLDDPDLRPYLIDIALQHNMVPPR